jgi:phosphatidate cytidylyltransferase
MGVLFMQNMFYSVPFILAIQFLFSSASDQFLSYVYTLGGILYCIVPFALLVQIPISFGNDLIPTLQYNYFKVVGIIFLIWANDTFAYLGGSLIGKNKLYEAVSPGKTWEGTVVGVIACVGVGFVLNLNHTFSTNYWWPLIALFVGVFGTVGDLIESQMKRKAGVKDSGSIMPGHGGILDRFDSLMFVSPFVYLIIKFSESAA